MPLVQIQHADPLVNRIQDQVSAALKPLDALPIKGSKVLAKQLIGTGDTVVYHQLGHPLVGWVVIRNDTLSYLGEGTASTTPNTTINLKANVAATVTLLVW